MKGALALIPVAALCVWGLIAWVVPPVECNQALNNMRGRTRVATETVNSYRQALLIRANLADLRRLEGPCRTNAYVYTLQAENEYALGRKEESIALLRRALAVDQRPEIYAAIGNTLFELGRVDEAVESYVIAARFNSLILEQIEADQIKREVVKRLRPAS
ncbi:MAG TPA: hypothetical protein VKB93_13280 [Thermoanaerobaculia bacterium]|nr:hypothetical protein [Thermoanaerobaculia bacterium]